MKKRGGPSFLPVMVIGSLILAAAAAASGGDPQSLDEAQARAAAAGTSSDPVAAMGDQEVLARTLYGEARGTSEAAWMGVASVVLNRVKSGRFRSTIKAVCLQPYQFSCWNAGDPNLPVLLAVTTDNTIYSEQLLVAGAAVGGNLPDATGGALYFHDSTLKGPPAAWGSVVKTATIAPFTFYRG